MTLVMRKERVAGIKSRHLEQISKMPRARDLAGSARKAFLALSLGAVGAWLAVGVVLFALFLFAIIRN